MRARYNRQSVERARQSMAEKLADPYSRVEDLADLLSGIARIQGYVDTIERIDYALNHEQGGKDAAIAEALDILTRGADDSWSGRSNEARRSYFDGVRDAIRDRRFGDLNPERGE